MSAGARSLGTKTCKNCKRDLPTEQYEQYKKGGARGICNSCKASSRNRMYSAGYDQYLRRLCSKLKYSRKETHEWCLEPEDLIDIWEAQAGKCAISGVNMTHHIDGGGHKEFNASIDRINADQGYTPQNVQLVAYRINIMRHTLSMDMFWWWVKNIHDVSID